MALALISSISILGSALRVKAARYSRLGGATGVHPKGRGGKMKQIFITAGIGS